MGVAGPGLLLLTPVSPQGDHHDAGHHRRVLLPFVSTADRAPIPPCFCGPSGCCSDSSSSMSGTAPGLRPTSLPGQQPLCRPLEAAPCRDPGMCYGG